jgi:hypothetical protein
MVKAETVDGMPGLRNKGRRTDGVLKVKPYIFWYSILPDKVLMTHC